MVRWLLFDYVDPDLGLSKAQRRSVRRRAYANILKTSRWPQQLPRRGLTQVAGVAVAFTPAATSLIHMAVFYLTSGPPLIRMLLALGLQIATCWIVMAFLARWSWRPFVLHALNELGYSVCMNCGHRFPPQGRWTQCAECGHPAPDSPVEAIRPS